MCLSTLPPTVNDVQHSTEMDPANLIDRLPTTRWSRWCDSSLAPSPTETPKWLPDLSSKVSAENRAIIRQMQSLLAEFESNQLPTEYVDLQQKMVTDRLIASIGDSLKQLEELVDHSGQRALIQPAGSKSQSIEDCVQVLTTASQRLNSPVEYLQLVPPNSPTQSAAAADPASASMLSHMMNIIPTPTKVKALADSLEAISSRLEEL